MNKELSPTNMQLSAVTRSPRGFDKFAKNQLFDLFEKFSSGCLQVITPEGTEHRFGDLNAKPQTIQVHRWRFFRRLVLHGEIGFGETYSDGDWSTDDLTGMIDIFIANLAVIPEMSGSQTKKIGYHLLRYFNILQHKFRKNTKTNSRKNISAHYDLSNDFYSLWLDKSWTYSSAWFNSKSESLESAQQNKYKRLCDKLMLKPGMRVLEIGCGWGGFSIFAAKNYQVKITALTISQAQFDLANKRVEDENLQDQVEIRLLDYRDIVGQFDAIVSIEMLEAVGHEFLPKFFGKCNEILTTDGRIGLQVIVCPDDRYDAMRKSVDWIKKHIFPGGQLPSVKAMLEAACQSGSLTIQHLENFGLHYAETLKRWRHHFNSNLDQVEQLGFDKEFIRKWNFYLAYCEAAFSTRNINVSQLILTRPNNQSFALEI